MQRFYGEKRDEYGRAEVGASVSVYDTGTSNLSTIYEASDPLTTPASAIPNPMTTDSNGRYGFAAPTGVYDIVIKGSGSVEYKNKVALFDQTTSTTTTAGGNSTEIQYNTGGVLSGSASLTTDGTNLTVGGYSSVEATRFNTSTPDTSNVVGNTYWDSTNGTLATVLDATAGVVLQHGQELHVSCVNKTGVLIPNGSAVYVNDAQGNRPTCALAKADSLSTCQVIGVTTQAIAINGTGLVTIAGDVHDFDTSIFSGDGKTLYLSAITAGLITEAAPASPNYLVTIGTNLNTTNNGIIFVSPSRPIALDTTLAADSGLVAPSQKATKTYADGLYQNILTSLGNTSSTALGDALVGVKSTLTGAVARTQHEKNSDTINVKDFGAIGDGITDDTAAIQAAITNAPAGSVINFGRLHKVTSQITISKPLTLRGMGKGNPTWVNGGSSVNDNDYTIKSTGNFAVFLVHANVAAFPYYAGSVAAMGVTFEDMKILGPGNETSDGTALATCGTGIKTDMSMSTIYSGNVHYREITFKNCTIRYFNRGVDLEGICYINKFYDTVISNCNYGFYADRGTDGTTAGSDSGGQTRLYGCTIMFCWTWAVMWNYTGASLGLFGCTISENNAGLNINQYAQFTMIGCEVESNKGNYVTPTNYSCAGLMFDLAGANPNSDATKYIVGNKFINNLRDIYFRVTMGSAPGSLVHFPCHMDGNVHVSVVQPLAWATGVIYVVGDRVLQASVLYECNTMHTSGVFATDAAKWTAKSSAWVTSTYYYIDNIVINSGTAYACVVGHTSGTFATDLAAGKWVLLPSPAVQSHVMIDQAATFFGSSNSGTSSTRLSNTALVNYAAADMRDMPYQLAKTRAKGQPLVWSGTPTGAINLAVVSVPDKATLWVKDVMRYTFSVPAGTTGTAQLLVLNPSAATLIDLAGNGQTASSSWTNTTGGTILARFYTDNGYGSGNPMYISLTYFVE